MRVTGLKSQQHVLKTPMRDEGHFALKLLGGRVQFDDLQSVLRMYIVILCVSFHPPVRLAIEMNAINTLIARKPFDGNDRNVLRYSFDSVIGRRHRLSQTPLGIDRPKPVSEGLYFGQRFDSQQVLSLDAETLGHVNPLLRMTFFDTDIVDQEVSRHRVL